jgi:hypothetical protein
MKFKSVSALGLVLAYLGSASAASAAEQLSIYGELGCAVYDADGEFMRLGKSGAYETVKGAGASFFQTKIEISKAGYRLLGPQFLVVDSYGNANPFPKNGPFKGAFSYNSEGRDFFEISLGDAEGSWDNTWHQLELVINPTLNIKLGCNFPSD